MPETSKAEIRGLLALPKGEPKNQVNHDRGSTADTKSESAHSKEKYEE